MPVVPGSLAALLSLLRPAFTAPTFETFCALVVDFLGRVGEHTVYGMWQAARLAGRLHHSRAHDFFARASWCSDRLGLLLLDLLVSRFLDPEAALTLAVDASVFERSGRKVHGAAWHHDSGAAPNSRGFRFGNCFVCVGLVVRIAALGERAWCLPVLFRLWLPTPKPTPRAPSPRRRPSQQELAAALVVLVAARYPGRRIDVVGDAAFACRALASPSERSTVTSRLRSNAVLHAPKPPPTGRRGRPRVKGERLGTPGEIAAGHGPDEWEAVSIPGRGEARVLTVRGLWYSVFGPRAVQVVIVRELSDGEGYRIALVSTAAEAEAAELIARYADLARNAERSSSTSSWYFLAEIREKKRDQFLYETTCGPIQLFGTRIRTTCPSSTGIGRTRTPRMRGWIPARIISSSRRRSLSGLIFSGASRVGTPSFSSTPKIRSLPRAPIPRSACSGGSL